MADITSAMIKELREITGLGMMECRKALQEADGDVQSAVDNLRKSSGLKAAKKSGRVAAEGMVATKIAADNSYGVVVEVNSETDFVVRDQGFISFVDSVLEFAFTNRQTDVDTIKQALEPEREALVQKIGENISIRRVDLLEGDMIGSYVHSNNSIAVLVSLSAGDTETAKDISMHIAAVNPRVINPDDMPEDLLEKEKAIIKAQPDMANKPPNIVEQMLSGRINKFLKENSLVKQPFVKNPEITVGQLADEAGAEILNFVRFEVGDGIEVETVDFRDEVAAQVEASS